LTVFASALSRALPGHTQSARGFLSAVARAITGTSWNGRRFFGLQAERNADQAGNSQ
jgi:hypothetical protein